MESPSFLMSVQFSDWWLFPSLYFCTRKQNSFTVMLFHNSLKKDWMWLTKKREKNACEWLFRWYRVSTWIPVTLIKLFSVTSAHMWNKDIRTLYRNRKKLKRDLKKNINQAYILNCLPHQADWLLQQIFDEVLQSILARALHQWTKPNSYSDFAYSAADPFLYCGWERKEGNINVG